MTEQGFFVAIEGIDGSGKTAVGDDLAKRLSNLTGRTSLRSRDPGTTTASEHIRKILLDKDIPLDPWQQALLYTAARRGLSEELKKSLAAGVDNVVDRWFMSTWVYQGMMNESEVLWAGIRSLHTECIGLDPDIYILLDVDVERAINRKREDSGGQDRFEVKEIEWRQQLHANYLAAAGEFKAVIIDANQPLHDVQKAVYEACLAHPRLKEASPAA